MLPPYVQRAGSGDEREVVNWFSERIAPTALSAYEGMHYNSGAPANREESKLPSKKNGCTLTRPRAALFCMQVRK